MITLVRPPQTLYKGSQPPIVGLPLGLLYIAANLKGARIVDALIETKVRRKNGGTEFGTSWKDMKKKLRESDIVGITCSFSSQLKNTISTAELVKEIDPKAKTMIGGPHATIKPKDFLKEDSVDFVVLGEGELVFPELVKRLKKGISVRSLKGIGYKEGGKMIINPRPDFIEDLDSLPFPAYHLVKMEDYFEANKDFPARPSIDIRGSERAVSMVTSRGCPYNCVFCSVHLHMGHRWRFHSSKYVLKHLKFLKDEYDVRHVHFEDDNISLEPKRFEEIIDGIRKLNITWDTPNGVRADTLNKKLLRKVKNSGCVYLVIGVESGDQRVLDEIVGKNLDLKKVEEIAKICKEIELPLDAFYVIGFPGETKQNIKHTIDFALRLNRRYDVYPYLFFATPLIGTRLYDICKKEDFFTCEPTPEKLSVATQGRGIIKTEQFDPEYLNKVAGDFRRKWVAQSIMNLLRYSALHPKILTAMFKDVVKKPADLKKEILKYVRYKYLLTD